MVGWHHQLDGHEFQQTPEVADGQGSPACCSPWGRKESDTTEGLNNNKYTEKCMDVRVGLKRKLSTEELMLLNYGVGRDS